MSKSKIICIVFVILYPLMNCFAQQTIPLRSDILFNVQLDSLERTKNSQEIILSIIKNTSDPVQSFVLNIDQTDMAWNVISAELNGEPLWLVLSDTKKAKDNVISWRYDKTDHTLRFYPGNWQSSYTLIVTARLNLLYPARIEKGSRRDIRLLINIADIWYQADAQTNKAEAIFR